MNAIEVLRSRDLTDIPLHIRKHREYQLKLAVEGEDCYRIVIVRGGSSLHDLSKSIMVVYNWLPKSTKFKYRTNTGSSFGEFKIREEINEKLVNRTSLQSVCIAEAFNHVTDVCEWSFAERVIKIHCMGVTPAKDKINRGLPRCCGGQGVGPPHSENLRSLWRPTWTQNDLMDINEMFLGQRFTRDIFKLVTEYELDQSSALRRCAPFFDDRGNLLRPFTSREFMFDPIEKDMYPEVWKFTFRVVRKCSVRELADPSSDFLCGIEVDKRVIVDIVHVETKRAHIIEPVVGWVHLRDRKRRRILQEIKHATDNDESFKF